MKYTTLLCALAGCSLATAQSGVCTVPAVETTVIPPENASTYVLGGGAPQGQ